MGNFPWGTSLYTLIYTTVRGCADGAGYVPTFCQPSANLPTIRQSTNDPPIICRKSASPGERPRKIRMRNESRVTSIGGIIMIICTVATTIRNSNTRVKRRGWQTIEPRKKSVKSSKSFQGKRVFSRSRASSLRTFIPAAVIYIRQIKTGSTLRLPTQQKRVHLLLFLRVKHKRTQSCLYGV